MSTHQQQNLDKVYAEATRHTAADLKTVATRSELRELSSLTLPEIEWLSEEIARVVPAGNVPGLILSGLLHMSGRDLHEQETQRHIDLLFRGARQTINRAVFGAFFVGPASIIYGYQLLLRLAGRTPDDAFPEGTWQYYLEFALREDSARHANETTGFNRRIERLQPKLKEADRLAAWLLTSAHLLRQNHALIANEWRERVVVHLLQTIAARHHPRRQAAFSNLANEWIQHKPYARVTPADGPDFTDVRRSAFDNFCEPFFKRLNRRARREFDTTLSALTQEALPRYIRQMSWLTYLEPQTNRETRVPFDITDACIGVIYDHVYTLIKLPALYDVSSARRLARTILSQPAPTPARLDDLLVNAPRGEQPALRQACNPGQQADIAALQHTPILINWDESAVEGTLAHIRQRKRGLGDHPLTIMVTASSVVFDQSHIFFDGIWGAAVAEIMTNEASLWAAYLANCEPTRAARQKLNQPALAAHPELVRQVQQIEQPVEANAENSSVALKRILALRKVLKQRSESARLTVNDLLVLYRTLHPTHYQPSETLLVELQRLGRDRRNIAREAHKAIQQALTQAQNRNPSILIPIDASAHEPRKRVFPMTFRNPLGGVMTYHQQALAALQAHEQRPDRSTYQSFESTRLTYLRILGGFGELLSAYKEIALTGQSASITSLKFLAHLPAPLQRLLNEIPNRFSVLNEIIKGEEVFSNIGRVAPGSSLHRFMTAKDDNTQKTFAWGLITDDEGVLHISLRDFRPHNTLLVKAGYLDMGDRIAQDYLDDYADRLNTFIAELHQITIAGPRSTAATR